MDTPWYKDGLKFKCTGCGKCCTGEPGYVWVSEEEIQQMAEFLQLSIKEFSIRYLRKANGRLALIESKKTFDCIFLKDRKCLVYGARPKQCRTFPFWPHILENQQAWDQTAEACEGINDEAPTISFDEIQKISSDHE